jgi:hypothetical protein
MKAIINISICLLFLKGLLAVGLTLYIIIKELSASGTYSMLAPAGCAVASFAFILACLAIWIRKKVE